MSLFKSSDELVEKMQSESENDICIYRFTPSVFRLVPEQLKKHFSIKEKLFLLFRFIRGYWIYYLAVGDEICAYDIIKRNYFHRYQFMNNSDVISSPNYTFPAYRGRGYATKIFKCVIADKMFPWKKLWGVIVETNAPSIAAAEHAGFRFVGYAKQKHLLYALTQEPSNLKVYCYKK